VLEGRNPRVRQRKVKNNGRRVGSMHSYQVFQNKRRAVMVQKPKIWGMSPTREDVVGESEGCQWKLDPRMIMPSILRMGRIQAHALGDGSGRGNFGRCGKMMFLDEQGTKSHPRRVKRKESRENEGSKR
jgi:hypothetical protein